MKEHPIIFSGEMVRAILDGRKTQTRRVITQQNSLIDGSGIGVKAHWPHLDWSTAWVDGGPSPAENAGPYWHVRCHRLDYCNGEVVHRVYPRVQPGDVLWVKETWTYFDTPDEPTVIYPLGGMRFVRDIPHKPPGKSKNFWRSTRYMPRWASRLALHVTRVRAERVQDISDKDAKAEGADPGRGPIYKPTVFDKSGWWHAFAGLWNSINRKKPGRAWADNPSVWCYEFEVQR